MHLSALGQAVQGAAKGMGAGCSWDSVSCLPSPAHPDKSQTRAALGPALRMCDIMGAPGARERAAARAPDAAEVAAAAGLAAELALLGAGDADRLFPASLDDAYAAGADEAEWRVML
jgi:hypothetical protein